VGIFQHAGHGYRQCNVVTFNAVDVAVLNTVTRNVVICNPLEISILNIMDAVNRDKQFTAPSSNVGQAESAHTTAGDARGVLAQLMSAALGRRALLNLFSAGRAAPICHVIWWSRLRREGEGESVFRSTQYALRNNW
jgi:hypothetical protein